MNRISKRRKGIAYHYYNGITMQMTYDLGKTEDLERFKNRNYFDSHNARLFYDEITKILNTITT